MTLEPSRPHLPLGDNLRGILWMLFSVAAFTTMGLVIKVISHQVPLAVILLFRQGVVLALLVPWMLRTDRRQLRTRRFGLHALRAGLAVLSFACFAYALGKLFLADAMTLTYTNPLWSILVGVLILGEPVQVRRWTATGAGFVGVLFVVKPTGAVDPAMLAALASAVLASLSMAVIKRLTTTESMHQIILYLSLIGTAVAVGPAIYFWRTPGLAQAAWLVAMGALAYVGQIGLARAVALAEITVVAPMDFLRMPFAAVLGLVLFAEVPDVWTVLGIIVIGLASAYIAHREAVLRREPGHGAGGAPPVADA
ncbi:MAG: hypothetical protein A3J29_17395 [Acidobacteria bacterium RIFCSPLOWO2_12_FULL_67_14b]|nr:MAG: hypothetical protein A3J29_17395 [Acidobacteria bacterium RIFCSPLOWO2_12_FULL_67_14b]